MALTSHNVHVTIFEVCPELEAREVSLGLKTDWLLHGGSFDPVQERLEGRSHHSGSSSRSEKLRPSSSRVLGEDGEF